MDFRWATREPGGPGLARRSPADRRSESQDEHGAPLPGRFRRQADSARRKVMLVVRRSRIGGFGVALADPSEWVPRRQCLFAHTSINTGGRAARATHHFEMVNPLRRLVDG